MQMPLVTTIVATFCLGGPAGAQSARAATDGLAIGDQAPHLDVAHWVKGDQVNGFNPEYVYVIEFWATWCGPCIAGMPKLSELQSDYRQQNVKILGISDEPAEKVRHFLKQVNPYDGKLNVKRADYTLAADPDGSVYRDYMVAAGESGIPTVFIVGRDSHIEWIGHPTFMPPVLARIVDGSWDRAAAKKIRHELEPKLMRAFAASNWESALRVIDQIVATDPALAQEFEAQKFTLLLTETDRHAEAYELGNALAERMWEDPQFLNQIAWFVVDNPEVRSRDLEFAQRIADRANELTRIKDAMILDTVARVHFEKGDVHEAIAWQTRAVEHLNGSVPPEFHKQIRETLKTYRSKVERTSGGAVRRVDD